MKTLIFPILVLSFVLPSHAQVARTAEQLEHSKLYQSRGMKDQKITNPGQEGLVVFQEVPLQPKLNSRLDVLHEMACHADAVIFGKVTAQTSLLVPDETFVFTDSEITVLEIMKNNAGAPVYVNGTIVVTRPGGTAHMNGRSISVRLNHFQEFVTDRQYLFFLKFLQKTGDYEAFGDRTFLVTPEKIHNLSGIAAWDESSPQSLSSTAVLDDIRSVASVPCK